MTAEDTKVATRFVAVIDVGKTNVKLVLRDLAAQSDILVRTRPNTVVAGPPYPHYDTDAIFAFLLDALREAAGTSRIDAIVTTTHGASGTLVDADGLVLPMLDYEHDLSGPLMDAYRAERPDFSETQSPAMPNGLNLGMQIHWLERGFPEDFARARHILTYPQYWGFRLTGVAAGEATSLGCHTDLWRPLEGRFSSLAVARGWHDLMPPMRPAFAVLGPLKDEWVEAIGLPPGTRIPVHNGIHDSNASLLPHLLHRETPFSLVSTGTWIVSFAVGGTQGALDPARDTLCNVDAYGRPVRTALYMGGREFGLLAGDKPAEPDEAALARVLSNRIMALPSFVPHTGPFPNGVGGWTAAPETLAPPERTAAASLYAAFMTAEALSLIGAAGPSVVEGPFSRNRVYLQALADVTGRDVVAPSGSTGTSAGAALLAGTPDGGIPALFTDVTLHPNPTPAFEAYRAEWLRQAPQDRREAA